MLSVPKTRPAIARQNRGRFHTYTIDGQKAPGVTSILGQVVAKPALVPWASRLVAEYAADNPALLDGLRAEGRDALVDHLRGVPDRAKRSAAARGTDVHHYAERVIAGEELEETEELAPLWGHIESCVAFLDDWQAKPLLVETVIGDRQHRYCGTLDLVAELPGGRRALIDYKTGASGIWPETALQLAAYRYAATCVTGGEEAALADLGITCAYAVHLRGDGYDVVAVDTEAAWPAFEHVAAAYHLGVGARDGGWSAWLEPGATP